MNEFDAIVIGSGIGGLSAAAFLLAKNPPPKVLLLEKKHFLGGRLHSYEKDGFKLDIGAHVISRANKGPVGDALAAVGKELKWISVHPEFCYKGKRFFFPRGLQDLVPEKEYLRLMEMFGKMMTLSDAEVTELDETSVRSFTMQFTENGLIHACIDAVGGVLLGANSIEASAGEFIRCLKAEAMARASGYPLGGCGAITNALAEGITDRGGVIKTGAGVEKIIVEDGQVKGVVAAGETYKSNVVISNADPKQTMLHMVGEGNLDKGYSDKIHSLEFSGSALILKIALDMPLADWKLLTYIGHDDPVAFYDTYAKGEVPSGLFAFMPCPSNFAPDVAPEGRQLLSVLVGCPRDFPKVEELKEAAIDVAESLIPTLRKHIMWIDETTPAIIEALAGEEGAGIGATQNIRQSGKNRLSVETPVKGLYLAGAEAGGWGVGTELAAESARLVVEKL